jgi:ferredoxin-NADP reductase
VPVPGDPKSPVQRSYSIASPPDPTRPTEIELAITRVEGGPVSCALHELPIGTTIETDGPFGFFTRAGAPAEQSALFVGTGTGVTPLRSMLLDELAREREGSKVVLLFGCRTEADIIYRSELEALARAASRFRYEITLSRPSPEWTGFSGYVQTHLARLVAELSPMQVYVCGLSKMVQDVRRILKETHGFDRKQIHTERYD